MRRIKRAKPSPALLVAVVALVAALAGTAIGGVAVTSLSKKDKKQVTKIAKKQGKKQANIQIGRRAPGLSVASAKTADRATTANSAGTANGIKPVRVNFTASTNSPKTVLLDEGGIRLDGSCDGLGEAQVIYSATADNGVWYTSIHDDDGSTRGFGNQDFDVPLFSAQATTASNRTMQVTLTYRGADGTTVSGELVQAQDAGAAQCVIAGTLFVG